MLVKSFIAQLLPAKRLARTRTEKPQALPEAYHIPPPPINIRERQFQTYVSQKKTRQIPTTRRSGTANVHDRIFLGSQPRKALCACDFDVVSVLVSVQSSIGFK
jgi:hypothetical protein